MIFDIRESPLVYLDNNEWSSNYSNITTSDILKWNIQIDRYIRTRETMFAIEAELDNEALDLIRKDEYKVDGNPLKAYELLKAFYGPEASGKVKNPILESVIEISPETSGKIIDRINSQNGKNWYNYIKLRTKNSKIYK